MSKRKQTKCLERAYKRQMKKPSPMPKEFKAKFDFYRALFGKEYSRQIYKAEMSEFIQPSPHLPFGWIALYDDYTDKDISFFFRLYKKERIKRLRSSGIKIRKYVTRNSIRDFQWAQLARKYKGEPNYIEIAKAWSRTNPELLRELVLQHLWRYPDKSLNYELEGLILTSKRKGQKFDKFVAEHAKKLMADTLDSETKDYVISDLPRTIRSAVHRFRKKHL